MRILPIALTILALSACAQSEQTTRADSTARYLASRSDLSPQFRSAIERGEILMGMSPDEASAAGGNSMFEVQKDPSVWPKPGTDPWLILAAQRLHPDNSKIILHFANDTQFKTAKPVPFSVTFTRGRVSRIERSNVAAG